MFKDNSYLTKIKENGFIKVPFLTESEINEILAIYNKFHDVTESNERYKDGMFMTTWSENKEIKLAISEKLKQILLPICDRFFTDYNTSNHIFSIKKSNNQNIFPFHQDWSIVDESKFLSLNFWIPLQDTDKQNGTLQLIKNSHKLNNYVRGPGVLFPDFSHLTKFLKKYVLDVPVKKGEAVIFYQRTLHGSGPNKTNNDRIATCFSISENTAPFQTYFQKDENSPLEIHHPKDDFMLKYDNLQVDSLNTRPSDQIIEMKEPYINKKITLNDIEKFLEANPESGNSFFSKLINLIKR